MPHVLDGDYAAQRGGDFRGSTRHHPGHGAHGKIPVPVAAAALQMLLMTSASGTGRDDDASVARMYAKVTGTHLPGEPLYITLNRSNSDT